MNTCTTINKHDNKLLYVFDKVVESFVVFVITAMHFTTPNRYRDKINKIEESKEMLHNVVGLAFFNAVGGFFLMVTQVKLANYFGASVYGIYSYCLAIGELGAMFVRYGRNKTMVRDLIQYPEKRDSLVVNTFFLSLVNLGLFIILAFLCHEPLDIEVSWTYFLLILSPCLVSLTLEPVYESLKLMSWSSIYNLLQKLVFLVVIWGLFLLKYHVSLLTVGIILVVTWLMVNIMQYYEIGTQLCINFIRKVNSRELWRLYKDNFVIFLSCITGVAFGPLLQLILNNYTDNRSVGIYAAGLQIYNICLFLNTQISRVGNPMMAEAGKKDCPIVKRKRLVSSYTLIMVITSLPFALPMLLFPSNITSLFFTSEYAELANYLPILAIFLLAMSIGVVFAQYMISLRLDKTYFTIYASSAFATVLLAFWIIPQYGILGAFISLCIPHSLGCLCYMLFSLSSLRKVI